MSEGPRTEFRAFEANFAAAAAAAGGVQPVRLVVAGKRLELQFAGAGLRPHLLSALSHHVEDFPGVPELVIQAWDTASTGVALAQSDAALERHRDRGMPSVPPEDGIYAAYLRPDPGLSMLDVAAGRAVYWLPRADRTPFEDRSGPFRGILNWWMSTHDRQFIHAAAVGNARGAVLVVGASGSGKSTAALSSMLAGLEYLGDDYCILEAGPRPTVHSLYLSAKLHAGHLENFPALRPHVANPERLHFEKGVLNLEGMPRVRISRNKPIRAVLVPRVTGLPESDTRPLPKPAALAALAPSTILQLASTRQEALSRMAQLVRQVPAFELLSGTDLPGIPRAIERLLDSCAISEPADG